jgi:formate hydrogenlyase transcriptional activator
MLALADAARMDATHEANVGISQEERFRSLLQVSRRLGVIRDPEELIRTLSRELQRILSFDHLSLFLMDVVGEGASWHIWRADDQSVLSPVGTVPLEETVEAWVIANQRAYSWPPRGGQPVFPGLEEVLAHLGVPSLCAVPLTTVNARLGAMSLASRRDGAYPEEEQRFLSVVADQVALAIDGAVSFERLRVANERLARSSERLKLILDVGSRVLSNLDLQELLRSISANVRQVLRCDLASVVLIDADRSHARLYVLDFPDSNGFMREGAVVPVEREQMEEFLRIGQPREVGFDEMSGPGSEFLRAEGISLGYAFPLVSRGRPLGLFTVMRRAAEDFDRDEIDLIGQVAGQVATALDNALAYGEIAGLRDQLAQEKLYLEDEIRSELSFEEIVGRSDALRRVLKQVETVAATDATVLVSGETGSGKELIARAIHDLGARRGKTFVKLSCAAIPTGLLESELFGHQKGAFTGAIADRVGRFELANGGTVFLDEIGEIPLELQPKLLRVLQEREFERLGSSKTLRTDARLIAATNRELAAMVEAGTFRADLFYRLNVFPIHVPALRERPEDIPLLVRHFVQQLGRRMGKKVETIPADTMTALTRYAWPGNIRELQNLIERAMILTNGPVLRVPLDDLKAREAPGGPSARPQTLQEAERAHVLSALEETGWVLGGPHGAAARLAMNRSTLQFRMKKLGIVRPRG